MLRLRSLRVLQRHAASFYRHNTVAKMRNLLSILLQQWKGNREVRGYPFEIIVDPTNVCKMRCCLCVTGQRESKRPPGMMDLEVYRRVVSELARWLYKIRFYSWGEPLLHPDIAKMIAYASENDIGTEMSTSLQNFGKVSPESLVQSGLELMIVSLDGASEETYTRYRVGGDFEAVLNNIRTLVGARKAAESRYPIIEIQFLVMKHNEHEMNAMKDLTRQLGADRVVFGPVVINTKDPEQVRTWLPRNERWSRYEYETLEDKIFRKRRRCPWLWRSAVLNWDGTVSPCCVFEGPETDMGSLKDQRFEQLWNGKMYQSARGVFAVSPGEAAGPRTICTACRGLPHAKDERQKGLY